MGDKRVDEDWKRAVEQERRGVHAGPRSPREQPAEDAASGFSGFVSNLGMQAMIALGEVEHPATQRRERDLAQAKYLIDIVTVLREKTKGNLTPEESGVLEELLYELQTSFVRAAEPGGGA